jgi:RHS repeat-associated protein
MLVTVTDQAGATTRYAYDAGGHPAQIIDAKGAVTRLVHDAAGRQVSSTDPLGRTTFRRYDKAGNLVEVIDPAGNGIRMSYDAAGRLIERAAADGAAVTFAYDAAGRRIRMTDATGTTRYSYDTAGRLSGRTDPDGGAFAWRYDAPGRCVALRYPSGTEATYSYDRNGRLAGLGVPAAGCRASFVTDRDGRLLLEKLPGSQIRRYRYRRGQLCEHTAILAGRDAIVTSFLRDLQGRIRAQRVGGALREFRYDRVGRLKYASAWEHDPVEIELAYDVVGNRVWQRIGEVETRYYYDAADQLTSAETKGGPYPSRMEFRYDACGRLIEDIAGHTHRTVRYDGFGLPVDLAWPGRFHAARTYNGLGQLSFLTVTSADGRSACVTYRWSTDACPRILCQHARLPSRLDGEFVYGYGRTLVRTSGEAGEPQWAAFRTDAFGSAIRTGETDAWVQAERYGIFGEPSENPVRARPPVPRFGYRGELALGPLIYLRSRTYDTLSGRFISRDPVALTLGPSHAAHPYVYARNDPLRRSEPTGKLPPDDVIVHADDGGIEWDIFRYHAADIICGRSQ